jgi:hypothetical protein
MQFRNRHNSTFKVRVDAAKPSRSRLSRKAPLRGRSRLSTNGRRTNDWRKVWRFLKPRLEAAGRTKCEFGFIPHECSQILDPAHSKKRNKMKGNDIYMVAIACRRIHDHLDLKCSHEEMEALVMRAIAEHGGPILPGDFNHAN